MDSSRTSQLGVVGLIVMSAALVAGLHSLSDAPGFVIDRGDPLAWLSHAPIEDTIGALLRYVGLAVGYWVLISTVLYFAATAHNPTRPPQWVKVMTLPVVRRAVERALATTLALSIAVMPVGPLRATDAPPAPVVYETADDGIPVPHVRLVPEESPAAGTPTSVGGNPGEDVRDGSVEMESTATSRPQNLPPVVSAPSPLVATTAVTARQAGATATYTVEHGDNLWRIAAAHLEAAVATPPSLSAIDAYWRTVIAANQGTLRSGDPNLIYPGEIITLPVVEESP